MARKSSQVGSKRKRHTRAGARKRTKLEKKDGKRPRKRAQKTPPPPRQLKKYRSKERTRKETDDDEAERRIVDKRPLKADYDEQTDGIES